MQSRNVLSLAFVAREGLVVIIVAEPSAEQKTILCPAFIRSRQQNFMTITASCSYGLFFEQTEGRGDGDDEAGGTDRKCTTKRPKSCLKQERSTIGRSGTPTNDRRNRKAADKPGKPNRLLRHHNRRSVEGLNAVCKFHVPYVAHLQAYILI